MGSLSREGFLYFVGLFGPILTEWLTRMQFDARFSWGDDPWHRLFELLHLCFLATAVVHIRPVDNMSNPSEYSDMFGFSLGGIVSGRLQCLPECGGDVQGCGGRGCKTWREAECY